MNFYVLLMLGVALFPLLFSFQKSIRFVRVWPQLPFPILGVGLPFLVWDIIAAERGHWSFNTVYAGPGILFSLPSGEFLFFVCVPFSCLFIYHVIDTFLPSSKLPKSRFFFAVSGAVAIVTAILFWRHEYTLTTLLVFGGTATILSFSPTIQDRNYLLYLAICFIPFLVINGILTALPVVQYGPSTIWGVRLGSIPLEDFFYNFSYLSLVGWVFGKFRPKRPENIINPKKNI